MPIKKKKVKAKLTRKKTAKKVIKKKPASKRKLLNKKKVVASKAKGPKEIVIGTVTHYFPKVRAAVVKLKANLSLGDTVKIKGHTTDFTQKISSLQIDRISISQAKKGQEIGLLVDSRVRQHDIVCKA